MCWFNEVRKHNRPLLVLHERKTRLTVMTRLASKTASETVTAITDILARLDPQMRRSMTFDNGTEFARHSLLKDALNLATYFCDAYASWQKGGIENANGHIRRWLPRNTDLDDLSEEEKKELHRHETEQYEKEHAHLYEEESGHVPHEPGGGGSASYRR